MKNEFPDMLSSVHDTIDTRRDEDNERNHHLLSHMMVSKRPRTTMSQF